MGVLVPWYVHSDISGVVSICIHIREMRFAFSARDFIV